MSLVVHLVGTSVARDVPLMEAGIDSLASSELVQGIKSELSAELPATLLFDHPSIVSITKHVAQECPAHSPGPNESAPAKAPAVTRRQDIEDSVRALVAHAAGTDIYKDVPLMEAGLDSLAATEFVQSVGAELEMDLPATLLFDHPSISSICLYFEREIGPIAGDAQTMESGQTLTSCIKVQRRPGAST